MAALVRLNYQQRSNSVTTHQIVVRTKLNYHINILVARLYPLGDSILG